VRQLLHKALALALQKLLHTVDMWIECLVKTVLATLVPLFIRLKIAQDRCRACETYTISWVNGAIPYLGIPHEVDHGDRLNQTSLHSSRELVGQQALTGVTRKWLP
jgi:hypothetical protein